MRAVTVLLSVLLAFLLLAASHIAPAALLPEISLANTPLLTTHDAPGYSCTHPAHTTWKLNTLIGIGCSLWAWPLWKRVAHYHTPPIFSLQTSANNDTSPEYIALEHEYTFNTNDRLRSACHAMHALAGGLFPLPTLLGTLAARLMHPHLLPQPPETLVTTDITLGDNHQSHVIKTIPRIFYDERQKTLRQAAITSLACGAVIAGLTHYVMIKKIPEQAVEDLTAMSGALAQKITAITKAILNQSLNQVEIRIK